VSGEIRTRRRPAVSDDDKLRRRDEIMAAAKKVFASNGFHSTTIADVAKEANLAYGSIYQYFDSKDDLFDALMSAEAYALRTHVAVALAATGQRADRSWEPLRAAVQATFEFFEKDKATAKLLLPTPMPSVSGSRRTSTTSTSHSSTTSTSTWPSPRCAAK
jgi:AcrR family transcriptional regulator